MLFAILAGRSMCVDVHVPLGYIEATDEDAARKMLHLPFLSSFPHCVDDEEQAEWFYRFKAPRGFCFAWIELKPLPTKINTPEELKVALQAHPLNYIK